MKKKILRAIDIARALKPNHQSGQHFHVSIAYKRSKIVSIAWNDYQLCHLYHRYGHYRPTRNEGANYKVTRHSEIRLLQKLILPPQDLVLINVKINADNEPSMAKPCENCARVINNLFKRVYYTIDSDNYGILT